MNRLFGARSAGRRLNRQSSPLFKRAGLRRHRRAKLKGRISVNSTTPTACSLANFTISAIPEYQKYLEDYPGRAGPGECLFFARRMLSKPPSRFECSHQFAESAHTITATANSPGRRHSRSRRWRSQIKITLRRSRFFIVPLAKSKEPAVALSARYFEARCLEALGRKDEAADIYAQVAEAGNPNPYREDARVTAASIFAARGKKARRAEAIRSAR